MPMTLPVLALASAVACGCIATAPAAAPEGSARIGIERGDVYLVHALFDGAADGALTYQLEVPRTGPAGSSQSAQSGLFESAEGRPDTLSTVQVSAVAGDRFEARLVVSRDGKTVSEAVVGETVR